MMELQFQRERVRRELQEAVNAVDEATVAPEGSREQRAADMMVLAKAGVIIPTFLVQYAAAVEAEMDREDTR